MSIGGVGPTYRGQATYNVSFQNRLLSRATNLREVKDGTGTLASAGDERDIVGRYRREDNGNVLVYNTGTDINGKYLPGHEINKRTGSVNITYLRSASEAPKKSTITKEQAIKQLGLEDAEGGVFERDGFKGKYEVRDDGTVFFKGGSHQNGGKPISLPPQTFINGRWYTGNIKLNQTDNNKQRSENSAGGIGPGSGQTTITQSRPASPRPAPAPPDPGVQPPPITVPRAPITLPPVAPPSQPAPPTSQSTAPPPSQPAPPSPSRPAPPPSRSTSPQSTAQFQRRDSIGERRIEVNKRMSELLKSASPNVQNQIQPILRNLRDKGVLPNTLDQAAAKLESEASKYPGKGGIGEKMTGLAKFMKELSRDMQAEQMRQVMEKNRAMETQAKKIYNRFDDLIEKARTDKDLKTISGIREKLIKDGLNSKNNINNAVKGLEKLAKTPDGAYSKVIIQDLVKQLKSYSQSLA